MELGRVELPSAIGTNTPFIHKFSLSNPLGGNYPLSRITGCFGKVLAKKSTKGN